MKKSFICLGVMAGILMLSPFPSAASPYVKSREVGINSDVDKALAADWQQKGLLPVAEASDSLLVRRLYLDLTGRLPSVEDAKSFVYSKDAGKAPANPSAPDGRPFRTDLQYRCWRCNGSWQ